MCGWIAGTGDPSWFSGLVSPDPGTWSLYQKTIRPTDPCPAIHQHPQGFPFLQVAHWGLVPQGCKDPRHHRHTCEVKAEQLMRPIHKQLFLTSRVLVPVAGFQLKPGGPWITGRGPGLMLAGICDTWHGVEGSRHTFALITCSTGDTHMPVVLGQQGAQMWLNQSTPPAALLGRLIPCPEHWLHQKG